MDLLVELIVSLFRALFGEEEPTADVGRRYGQRGQSSSSAASPRPTSSGSAPRTYGGGPKSLAELLDEARRQARDGEKRPTVSNPRVQEKVPPAPLAPPPLPAERRQEQPARERPSVEPFAASETKRRASSSAGAKAAVPSLATTEIGRGASLSVTGHAAEKVHRKHQEKKPSRKQDFSPSEGTKALSPQEAQRLFEARTAAPEAVLAFVRTRDPAERLEAARNAVVFMEIFGPPRALRPYRPPHLRRLTG